MLVYLITNNLENNKPYVGKLVDETRFNRYWGSGNYIKSAIKKYGKEKFKKIILETGINDYILLSEREKYWIKVKNSRWPNGYNLTDGGDGQSGALNPGMSGRYHSAETKAKISAANKGKKGKKRSEEAKRRAVETRKNNGKPWHSKETIDKMKIAQLGENNPMHHNYKQV